MRVELVGGPHCGHLIDVNPRRQTTVWAQHFPTQATHRLPWTNAPATPNDVAYTYDAARDRYVFSGQYEAA